MVNLSKRMSIFQPKLLDIRHGKGAHVLPPAPAPQLTDVFLRYPRRDGLRPDSRTDGAHQFQERYLPRLKYYNPTLKIDVKTDGNTHSTMKLVLQFEGANPEALRAIARKSTRVKPPPSVLAKTQEELEEDAQKQSPNWRDAPAPEKPQEPVQKHTADDDEVVLKPQGPTQGATQSSTPIYTRSVTLPVNNKPHWQIWSWFKRRTGVEAVPMTDADRKLKHTINKETQQRETDRAKGAVISAQLKKERDAMEQAKKAADEAAKPTA